MVGRALSLLVLAGVGLACGSTSQPSAPASKSSTAQTLMCPSVTRTDDLRRIDALRLIGLPEAVAGGRATRGGCEMRVSFRDGHELLKSADYRSDRVNVRVRAGVVVAVDDIG
jgi:hypothetical protein